MRDDARPGSAAGAPPSAFADDFLTAVVDVARIGICITNAAGTLVRVNPAICTMLGYRADELVGQHYAIAAPSDIAARAADFLAAVLRESPRVRDEWRIRRKDGEIFDALVSFKALTLANGERFIVVTFSDITERKQAERSLRESEERFRQLAENIDEVFWITDPAKQVMIYVSPAYERVWGRRAQELYEAPQSFLDAIHGEDRERVRAALVLQQDGRYSEEYRIVRPDGAVRWIRDRAYPVRDAAGTVYRIAGIATDITERRFVVDRVRRLNVELEERIGARTAELTQTNANLTAEIEERRRAEARLRELTERMQLLIDTANDAIVTIDQKSIILDWNAAAERMFGWRRDEACGRVITDLVVPAQHRAHHHSGLRRFLESGVQGILNRRVETTGLRRDGGEFDIELSVWPVRTDHTYTFSSFIRDISERKRGEQALALSEERYRAVVENAEEGIIVSQDGMLRFANPKSMALAGRTAEQIYSTPFIEMIHPEDRPRVYSNYLRRLKGEAVENQYNFRVHLTDGGIRWLQISAVMIEWDGRPATLNFLTDVTERQRADEETRRALERERELSELKSRFVAMTSHEFRTPLAAILSSAELLEDHGESLPEVERREVLALVKGAVKRMNEMIGQVLLLGRTDAGHRELRLAPLEPASLCSEIVDEARHAGQPAKLVFAKRGDGHPRLLDQALLRHILGNLVGNALKYSGPGGEVRLNLTGDADGLTFSVSDDGIGIPEQDLPRLFDPFHRGANVGNIEGTGLGLAIVKQSVEIHGGNIAVDSRMGGGTRFTVRIPGARLPISST